MKEHIEENSKTLSNMGMENINYPMEIFIWGIFGKEIQVDKENMCGIMG